MTEIGRWDSLPVEVVELVRTFYFLWGTGLKGLFEERTSPDIPYAYICPCSLLKQFKMTLSLSLL